MDNPMTEHSILNNGISMPKLGLGVYQSGSEETVVAVTSALSEGYRMIDTAAAYFNEESVGQALREADIPREDVFVQTKLWMNDYGRDATLHAFERSMRNLGLEVLDSWLMHWPVPKDFARTVESWQTMIELVNDGRIHSIGVSNFSLADLERLIGATGFAPALNQVELHPYFAQPDLRVKSAEKGIVTQAWSPIGGVSRYAGDGALDPLSDPVLTDIARAHGKTAAQIILRWHLQHGVAVIPKSVKPERIRENSALFDFALTEGEMGAIDDLNRGERAGPDPDVVTPELFGLHIED